MKKLKHYNCVQASHRLHSHLGAQCFAPLILLVLVLSLPFSVSAQEWLKVKQVINGKSFIVESGDTVRLASIEAPNLQDGKRTGEPLGEEAKAALEKLILGKNIRIEYLGEKRDRHNRLIGQVYDEKGNWIQGEILKSGFAFAYIFADDSHETIVNMLKAETIAQNAKIGLWQHPYYRVLNSEETQEFINRFKLVEGTIESVNQSHDNIYINFSKEWKGKFAVFISKKNAANFSLEKLKTLIGKKVRIRGWINYHKAPMISIVRQEQIENKFLLQLSMFSQLSRCLCIQKLTYLSYAQIFS